MIVRIVAALAAVLLANFSAPELASIRMRRVDTTTTLYARTATENIRDFMVWYQAATK